MSCRSNNSCSDTPYPQASNESVPSLIENLVTALYGKIRKTVMHGRVVWNIPCDPANSSEVKNFPRYQGEGLLCYILRVFNNSQDTFSTFLKWKYTGNGVQTIFEIAGASNQHDDAYLVYIDGVVQDSDGYQIQISSPSLISFDQAIPNGSVLNIIQLSYSTAGTWYTGNGSPEGTIAAPIGSIYSNTLGGSNQTFWVKESGSGSVGWIAK